MTLKKIAFILFLIFFVPFFYNCYREYNIGKSNRVTLCGIYTSEGVIVKKGGRSSSIVSYFKVSAEKDVNYFFLKYPRRYFPIYIIGKHKKFEILEQIFDGDKVCVVYSDKYQENYNLDYDFPFIFDVVKN